MRKENLPINSGEKNQVLQIINGGTSATNNDQALENLGAINPNVFNKPGGVVALDNRGYLLTSIIPSDLNSVNAVNIEGPDTVQVSGVIFCYITNFDSFTDYVIKFDKVIVSREGNVLAVEGFQEGNNGWFSVNGSKFYVVVTASPIGSLNPINFSLNTSSNFTLASLAEFGNTLDVSNNGSLCLVGEPNYQLNITYPTIGYTGVINGVGRTVFYNNQTGDFLQSQVNLFSLPNVQMVYSIASSETLYYKTDTQSGTLIDNGTFNLISPAYVILHSSGGNRTLVSVGGEYQDGVSSIVTIGDFSKTWTGQKANGTLGEVNVTVVYAPNENRRFGEVVAMAKEADVFGIGSCRSVESQITNGGEVTFFYKILGVLTKQLISKPRDVIYPSFGNAIKFSNNGSDVLVASKGSNLVYLFNRTNGSFIELSQFTKPGIQDDAKFGYALDATPDLSTVIVSAPNEGGIGIVCVYTKIGNTFNFVTSFSPTYISQDYKFGNTVKINKTGTKIFVTAYRESDNEGFIIIYNKSVEGVWYEDSTILNPISNNAESKFGYSLDVGGLDDKILVVGAPGSVRWNTPDGVADTPPISNSNGFVHIFVDNGFRWSFYKTLPFNVTNSQILGYGSKVKLSQTDFTVISTSKSGLFYNKP